MRTASIGIVALLLMNAFAAAASATIGPAATLDRHDSALQQTPVTGDVLPLWGAPPGPYGPSNLTLLYKSPAFNGTPSVSKFANLDGDGDQDLVFCTVNETNKYNVSAIDTGTFSIMWSNVSLTSTGYPSIMARDFRGVGRDDLLISQFEGMGTLFTFIFGSNGTVGWTYSTSFTSGLFYGDINADGALEFVVGLMMGSDTAVALNMTTGTKVWNSTTIGGFGFTGGQMDNDTQIEIVYTTSDFINSKYNVLVYDMVLNKTEWQVNHTTMVNPSVRDWDADGKDEVIICQYLLTPHRLTMYDNGTQIWTNNVYQAPVWFNRIWNSDNDTALEIIDSDPASHDIEIIDGATGLAQGYWTCTTYAPSDTFTIPPDVDGTRYIASFGGSGSNIAITVFWGSNLTIQHQYKFTEWISLLNLNDTDADGYSELVFWTWTGNLSLYNFTSHNLKWKKDGMKVSGLNTAWILGDMSPSGRKVMDLATVTCPVAQTCRITFMNASDGNITNSTIIYQGNSVVAGDLDYDGGSELVFLEGNYTGYNRTIIHLLKAPTPPSLNATIPTITVNEDSINTHVLDLERVFLFNKTTTTMTYTIVPPTGTSYVTPTLDGKWVNIATAVQNWNGDTSINITGSDGVHADLKAQIPVKVLPINDAPVITPVPAKSFVQDQLAQFDVVATDPDGDLINFTDNTTLFEINATTGNVSFTPTNDDIGVYPVNVTVTDKWGLNSSVEFTVTILNANDAPNITAHYPDPFDWPTEDMPFWLQFNGTDLDLKWGDTITWSAVLTPNGSKGDPTWLKMNAATGNLTGTPSYKEQGGWRLSVNLTDSIGAKATTTLSFDVRKVLHSPVFVDVPGDVTMELGETFTFDVNATDEDPEDTLEFMAETSPASDLAIDPNTGIITFTPTSETDLFFEVHLTVRDSDGSRRLTMFNITVTLPPSPLNHPPTAILLAPADGTEIDVTAVDLKWDAEDEDMDIVTGNIFFGTDRALVLAHDPLVLSGEDVSSTSLFSVTFLERDTTYYWTVIPSDGKDIGNCTSGVWSFKVKEEVIPPPVNHPPTIDLIPAQEATAGSPFTYIAKGMDPDPGDGPNLIWSLQGAPTGMAIDPKTGVITWTPTDAQVGNYTVLVTLSDGKSPLTISFPIMVKKGEGGGGDDGGKGTGTTSMLPYMLLMVLLVIVAVVVALMMMRRKKSQAPAPAPPQPMQPPQPLPQPGPTPEPQPMPMEQQYYQEPPQQEYYQEQQYTEQQQLDQTPPMDQQYQEPPSTQ